MASATVRRPGQGPVGGQAAGGLEYAGPGEAKVAYVPVTAEVEAEPLAAPELLVRCLQEAEPDRASQLLELAQSLKQDQSASALADWLVRALSL